MKRRSVLLTLAFLVSIGAWAQFNFANRQRSNQAQSSNKFYFGMGGGFGAGTDVNGYSYNYYSIIPTIGYRLTNQYSVGATFTYQRTNYPGIGYSYKQYGIGPFFRYSLNPLFFQTEYDIINASSYDIGQSSFTRWLFGIGYVYPLGKRSAISGLLMYDVLYHIPSVFNSPLVVRVYFTF